MTEKFKTKYHALAWAAEDENNVFVDGSGDKIRVTVGGLSEYCPNKNHPDRWYNISSSLIKEPCHGA